MKAKTRFVVATPRLAAGRVVQSKDRVHGAEQTSHSHLDLLIERRVSGRRRERLVEMQLASSNFVSYFEYSSLFHSLFDPFVLALERGSENGQGRERAEDQEPRLVSTERFIPPAPDTFRLLCEANQLSLRLPLSDGLARPSCQQQRAPFH